MPNQSELRQQITSEIISALQQGTVPWRRPWIGFDPVSSPTNFANKRRYSGINVLILQLAAWNRHYQAGYWSTYKQWQSLGCQVRRGEKATQIVFYKPVKSVVTNDAGEEKEKTFPLMRTFPVFNISQVDGTDKFLEQTPTISADDCYERAELAIVATGATIRLEGDRAYYRRPPHDDIFCPSKSSFFSLAEFYQTVLHELVHFSEWRLDWSGSYAEGELRAEIGAVFLSSALNIPNSEDLTNHQAYVGHWLKEMAGDPNYIFRAAAAASKAADYILGFSQEQESNEPDLVSDAT